MNRHPIRLPTLKAKQVNVSFCKSAGMKIASKISCFGRYAGRKNASTKEVGDTIIPGKINDRLFEAILEPCDLHHAGRIDGHGGLRVRCACVIGPWDSCASVVERRARVVSPSNGAR